MPPDRELEFAVDLVPFLAGQSDFSGHAIYAYLILGQPIHSQNNVQLYRLNDYQGSWKIDSIDTDFQITAD